MKSDSFVLYIKKTKPKTKKLDTVSAKPDVLNMEMNGVTTNKSKNKFKEKVSLSLNLSQKNMTKPTIKSEKTKFKMNMLKWW